MTRRHWHLMSPAEQVARERAGAIQDAPPPAPGAWSTLDPTPEPLDEQEAARRTRHARMALLRPKGAGW